MRLEDIVAMIPDDELVNIRKDAEELNRTNPVNENDEPIDWFRVIVEDWWRHHEAMPNGWFRWWEEE